MIIELVTVFGAMEKVVKVCESHVYKYHQNLLSNFEVVFWKQRKKCVRFQFRNRLLNVNTWIKAI